MDPAKEKTTTATNVRPFSLTHDGDLYVATLLESRWIIIRYPASPLFAPAPVEITKLPQQLYDEFSAYFLRRSKSLPNGESEI